MSEMLTETERVLQEKADLNARLRLIPYEGTPEIKENKSGRYLYVRKRVAGKLTSTYVDVYSDELYQILLTGTKEARAIRKEIRRLDKKLAELGYSHDELKPEVIRNLDYARANIKNTIYSQAVLEGIGTTFPQTEDIIENGVINGVSSDDVQKILNLKHAWEFVLDEDVLKSESDYYLLSYIAGLVNEGFYTNGGRIRGVPVTIGGSSYIPPLPIESVVRESIDRILTSGKESIDIAIELCMYCMKTQVFIDGNKRTAVIHANHYLISRGMGIMYIPEKAVHDFKKLLVDYYEGEDISVISDFLKEKCWQRM